jgi:hypothetical protein
MSVPLRLDVIYLYAYLNITRAAVCNSFPQKRATLQFRMKSILSYKD